MWIIVYIFIGILYRYLAFCTPVHDIFITGDFDLFAFLIVIDIIIFAMQNLSFIIHGQPLRAKWYQLIVGIILSVIAFIITASLWFIFGMHSM